MLKFFMAVCILTFVNIYAEDIEFCEATGSQNGTCVPLPSCPHYVALLKETDTTEVGLNIAHMHRCGFEGSVVKICCPPKAVEDMNNQPNSKRTNDFVDDFPKACGITDDIRLNCIHKLSLLLNAKPAYTGISRWMALLGYRDDESVWKCGGSIITQRHILTAGHCIKPSLFVVRLGEINLDERNRFLGDPQPVDYIVERTIRHEDYTKYHNDIGLVVLENDIQFTEHISPVCLPVHSYSRKSIEDITHGTVTGWGVTESGKASLQLLYASVKLYDNDDCRQIYKNNVTIDERVLCAGENGTDSCQGDSGGPFVWKFCIQPNVENYTPSYMGYDRYFQIGIVSYGFKCEFSRFKGVYTNIIHFLPWIEEKVLGKKRT